MSPAGMSVAAGVDPTRDDSASLALGESDFAQVAERILGLAGIVIEPHKRQMIQTRLSRRVRALGLSSIREYLDLLEGPSAASETQNFIDALTTNLTSFFRESHHFDHLAAHVLKANPQRSGPVKIWSAGCSSGEEPYTIALTALRAAAADTRILATDLDATVLQRAKTGEYPAEKCTPLDVPELRRYVRRDTVAQTVTLGDELKRMITFRQLNLMEQWPMSGPFDAIFCRNVVIYFSSETKAGLLTRFAKLVRPGGFLYLGHSEAILGDHPFFESCGNTIYRRKAD